MTAFYDSELIDVVRHRAAEEPCTCVWVVSDPNFPEQIETCLRCVIVGLQPSVTAFEPGF